MDVYVYMHFLLSSLIFCPEGWTSAFLLLARFHLVAHPVGDGVSWSSNVVRLSVVKGAVMMTAPCGVACPADSRHDVSSRPSHRLGRGLRSVSVSPSCCARSCCAA